MIHTALGGTERKGRVEERLGHHTPAFTPSYYTHTYPAALREAVAGFERLLEAASTGTREPTPKTPC